MAELHPALAASAQARLHTRHALAQVGERLARSVARRLLPPPPEAEPTAHAQPPSEAPPDPELARALAFAHGHAVSLPAPDAQGLEGAHSDHPLHRLAALGGGQPTNLLTDLVLLACLSEAHEGFATLLRLLHPEGQPWPTVSLALMWLEQEAVDMGSAGAPQIAQQSTQQSAQQVLALRDAVEALLCHGPLARLGLLRCEGAGPWHGRTLRAGPHVWPALMGHAPAAADDTRLLAGYTQVPGLDAWLQQPEVQQAVQALRRGLPCHLLLVGGDAAMRHTRVRALLGAAQTLAVQTPGLQPPAPDTDPAAWATPWASRATPHRLPQALATAWLYSASLWLEDRHDDPQTEAPLRGMQPPPGDALPLHLPVISSAASERRCAPIDLPQIRLVVRPLAAVARRALWQSLLPQLGEQAQQLAARYPIEPDDARDVVRDLTLRQHLDASQPLALDAVGECVRSRTAWHARPGLRRIRPEADWSALLLPAATLEPLHAAVRRVLQQITVLDDWGFAQGRSDRRGVRMLFHGQPGTGKTLAAEVMARALGVDLLVVDLASLVSKYIGETEKNLAAVFEVAERSRALLLFDEADALFGRRTDVQDAHDRHANLETAYLLQRLERYEGVAVLTTNLRAQLDKAFSRRFEFIVEFPEPDTRVRRALWRLHLPPHAPLQADVDLAELADWYALSGAQIKNAALAAAFLAAAAGQPIGQTHFLWAIEREFDKAGRAHPGIPPHRAMPATPQHTP